MTGYLRMKIHSITKKVFAISMTLLRNKIFERMREASEVNISADSTDFVIELFLDQEQ